MQHRLFRGSAFFAAVLTLGSATAQVAPEDAVCCRGSTQELLSDTLALNSKIEADLLAAQQAMRACEARVSATPCPADVTAEYTRCSSDHNRDVRAFCQAPSEESCRSETNPAAKRSCETLASINCQQQYENYRIISGVAYPGNPCVAARDQACPTVAQGCTSERRALNRLIAQSSELNVALPKIRAMGGSPAPGCVQLDILDFRGAQAERLCTPSTTPELTSVASYSCARNGHFECVFIGCREVLREEPKPRPPQLVPINFGGQDKSSSGLQGGPTNYHTIYTVAFSARVGSNRVQWDEVVRIPGPRSWYGFHYSACTRVPLRDYCAAHSRLDFIRSVARPPHGTECY
jgi:hypothetical protein